ncbi:hypothetical protein C0J52_19821 [Blattella germanica]|nr:hypothetical protein C0J52_19821 [Blattella germanica]
MNGKLNIYETTLVYSSLTLRPTLNTVSRRQDPLNDESKQFAGILIHHSPRQNISDVNRCLSRSDVGMLLGGIREDISLIENGELIRVPRKNPISKEIARKLESQNRKRGQLPSQDAGLGTKMTKRKEVKLSSKQIYSIQQSTTATSGSQPRTEPPAITDRRSKLPPSGRSRLVPSPPLRTSICIGESLIELLSTPLDAAGDGDRVGPSDSEY